MLNAISGSVGIGVPWYRVRRMATAVRIIPRHTGNEPLGVPHLDSIGDGVTIEHCVGSCNRFRVAVQFFVLCRFDLVGGV
jgi:hypothetical protein